MNTFHIWKTFFYIELRKRNGKKCNTQHKIQTKIYNRKLNDEIFKKQKQIEKKRKYSFNYMIKTDGVSISNHFKYDDSKYVKEKPPHI